MMINITETIHSSKMALLSICLFGLRETVHNNPQCGTPATFQNVGFSFGPWWARCRSSVSKVVFGMVQNSVPQDIEKLHAKDDQHMVESPAVMCSLEWIEQRFNSSAGFGRQSPPLQW